MNRSSIQRQISRMGSRGEQLDDAKTGAGRRILGPALTHFLRIARSFLPRGFKGFSYPPQNWSGYWVIQDHFIPG